VKVETAADGEKYIQLGGKKRVSVSTFKKAVYVNVREYYTTPDGEERPGKKGITLQKEQVGLLAKSLPQLLMDIFAVGYAEEEFRYNRQPICSTVEEIKAELAMSLITSCIYAIIVT
jgi:hypothetical protein